MPELVKIDGVERERSVAEVRSQLGLHVDHSVRLVVLKGVLRVAVVQGPVVDVLLAVTRQGHNHGARHVHGGGIHLQGLVVRDGGRQGVQSEPHFRIAKVRIFES